MEIGFQNNQKFITSSEAAKLIGYSSDYVAKLAREGKILAKLDGRKWMVDPDSLKLFILKLEADKRARQELLRQDRLLELAKAKSQLIAESQSSALANKNNKLVAAVGALSMFLIIGFSVFLGTLIVEEDLEGKEMSAGVGEVWFNFIKWWPWQSIEEIDKDTFTPIDVVKASTESAEKQNRGGLIMMDNAPDSATKAAIEQSFSDEVLVEFKSDSTGVVTPVFENVSSSSYNFLLVPVNEIAQ